MGYFKYIVILLIFLTGQARADEWTNADTAFELTYLFITNRDRQQTINCARTPKCSEANPLLGRTPSEDKINLSIAAAAAAHVWIATELNQPYRRIWQLIWIGVEYNATERNDSKRKNYQVGVRFAF